MTLTLRHGDRIQAVRDLQKQLISHGAPLQADGIYGDQTEAAVRDFQLSHGLVADGIAGAKTLAALHGGGCQKLLGHQDLVRVAAHLALPLATVYAVNEVESRGSGFLPNGKPVILFERHVMHRQLQLPRHPDEDPAVLQQHADALAREHPALVNPQPGGYAGGTAEHQRLANARLIDDRAALESASWGAFQIMGLHWQRLGFASVHAFVAAMSRDESEHFSAFARFIETDPALHKALQERKWATFARRYNGPDYQRHLYDARLQRAYQRHAHCPVLAAAS